MHITCNTDAEGTSAKNDFAVDNDLITHKEVYENLWKCRDFELKHCWQRSIFLTAFLVACYAGYGQLILETLNDGKNLPLVTNQIINGYAFIISLIGMVLSVFWVQMGKASKAWYECYEKAIVAFADQEQYFNKDIAKFAGFKYREIPGYKSARVTNWLWSTAGGGYSPSRINIAVGHLSLLIWSIAAVVHLLIAAGYGSVVKDSVVNPAFMGSFFVIVILCTWVYSFFFLKSRWLNETDSQKAGHFTE